MKFTLSWLKDHLDTEATIDQLSSSLNAIGIEVESVTNAAEKLQPFVIARVLEAKQHPNADKLRVCQVDAGAGVVEVVCGAPNARSGLVGVFAPTGTYIPGTGVKLEAKPVRGVVSNGMLCSERELELSSDHDGIIELPAELASRVGERYVDVLGIDDPVFDVKVTPNRPDALAIRGIARDLAACGLGTLKPADQGHTKPGTYKCPVAIRLEFAKGTENACPAFAGLYIRGVSNGPSPQWLQSRLKAIGLRPISALVDITNYITFDRSRPLHVYDADKLTGAIVARLGRNGETVAALDGKNYTIDPEMTVIADDSGPLGLGGIIGGTTTGCSDTTVNVLIESAWFDPLRSAATGRKTGVRSDARFRFERGVDPNSLPLGLALATRMILEICGGEPSQMLMAGKPPVERRTLPFDPAHVKRLGGLEIEASKAQSILTALGFEVGGSAGKQTVVVPGWRPDVHGPADLVEEIVRIAGIDTVPLQAMPGLAGVPRPRLTEFQKRVRRARRTLASRGFVEAITWSFIRRSEASAFGGGSDALELENPISSEMSSMRPSLLPGLLAAMQRNLDRGLGDHALFEVGQAYRGDRPEDQAILASGVRSGNACLTGDGRSWDADSRSADVFAMKADAATLLASLGVDAAKAQVTRDAPRWFHPGRSGTFRLGPKLTLGAFGDLHPDIARSFGIDRPIAAIEIDLSALPVSRAKSTRAKPLLEMTALQPVRRDFAFIVDRAVAAGDLLRAVSAADKTLIADAKLFDVYEGGALGDGKKSLAVEVTLQAKSETLTDKDIEAVAARIIEQVRKATGGVIRG